MFRVASVGNLTTGETKTDTAGCRACDRKYIVGGENMQKQVHRIYLLYQKNLLKLIAASVLLALIPAIAVYGLDASAGVAQFDAIVSFLATWIGRIGGLVIFIGAIQFGLAVYNQSPEGKVNGFLIVAAGAMLIGLAAGYEFFINV